MNQSYQSVRADKPNVLEEIFGRSRGVVIGVVHARPLPGSPDYEGEPVEDLCQHALDEALRYREGGVDGVIVENHGDIPFSRPGDLGFETAAVMSVMADRIRREAGLPVGINVLANGAQAAMAVAKSAGARFIRVNQWVNAYVANEGLIEGPAARVTRYRSWLKARDIRIFADVLVKHGAHALTADRTLEEHIKDAEWFDADLLITTGERTGDPPSLQNLQRMKDVSRLPVLAGSGVREANVAEILSIVDGCIVASSLKENGAWWNQVEVDRVRSFMKKARSLE